MFNLLMRIVFDIDKEYKVGSFLVGFLLVLGDCISWMDKDATPQTINTMVVLTSWCLIYWAVQDVVFANKFRKRPSILECKYEEMSDYFWGTVGEEDYRFMKTKLLVSMVITILVYSIAITSILLLIAK